MKFPKILATIFFVVLFLVLIAFIIDMQIKTPLPLGLILGAGLGAGIRAIWAYKKKNVIKNKASATEGKDNRLNIIDKHTLDKS